MLISVWEHSAVLISGIAVNISVMLTLMCSPWLIKQRSHQLWDSQSIYSSNDQRRAGLTTQIESKGSSINMTDTLTHILFETSLAYS